MSVLDKRGRWSSGSLLFLAWCLLPFGFSISLLSFHFEKIAKKPYSEEEDENRRKMGSERDKTEREREGKKTTSMLVHTRVHTKRQSVRKIAWERGRSEEKLKDDRFRWAFLSGKRIKEVLLTNTKEITLHKETCSLGLLRSQEPVVNSERHKESVREMNGKEGGRLRSCSSLSVYTPEDQKAENLLVALLSSFSIFSLSYFCIPSSSSVLSRVLPLAGRKLLFAERSKERRRREEAKDRAQTWKHSAIWRLASPSAGRNVTISLLLCSLLRCLYLPQSSKSMKCK